MSSKPHAHTQPAKHATHRAKPPEKPHDPTQGQPDPRLLNTAPQFTSPADVKRQHLEELRLKLGKSAKPLEHKRMVHDGYVVVSPVQYIGAKGEHILAKPYQPDGSLTVIRDMSDVDIYQSLQLGSIEVNMVPEDQALPALPESSVDEDDEQDILDESTDDPDHPALETTGE